MREKGNDELSALMDGEVTELEMHRVLRNVEDDPEQAAKWQRYHLVSAILKKELRPGTAQQFSHFDIASRVSAALAEEPVLQAAPQNSKVPASDNAWWKSLASTAIAASVAAAVVIGWQQTQPGVATPVAPVGVAQLSHSPAPTASSINGAAMPVQYGGANVAGYGNGQYAGAMPVAQTYSIMPRSAAMPVEYVRTQRLDEERFNRYLFSHSGNAAFTANGGQLPYVRVVTLKPVEVAR